MKSPRILTAIGLGLSLFATPLPAAPAPLTADEAKEIAVNAYIYAYPMVLMEATRRVISNAEQVDAHHAPIGWSTRIGGTPFSRSRCASRKAWRSSATAPARGWIGTRTRCAVCSLTPNWSSETD